MRWGARVFLTVILVFLPLTIVLSPSQNGQLLHAVFSPGPVRVIGPICFVSKKNPSDVVVGVARMLSCGARPHLPICLSDFLGRTLHIYNTCTCAYNIIYNIYIYVHIYMYNYTHVYTGYLELVT